LTGALIVGAGVLSGAQSEAAQIYAPMWSTELVEQQPCLLSIALPVSETDKCIPWTRRESSGATFDRASRTLLVGGSDGLLHALDFVHGAEKYAVDLPGALLAKPIVLEESVYFGTDDAKVLRADVATGATKWEAAVDAEVLEPVTVDSEIVVAITGLDTVYAFRRDSGEPLWVHKHPLPRGITLRGQARPLIASVQTADGPQRRVYIGHASGRVSILEATTGRVIDELAVSADEPLGDIDADPFEQEGKLVVASHTKGVVAYDLASNAEVWRTTEPGIVRIARGGPFMVVAAGAGKVLGIDARTGTVKWRFTYDRGAPTRIAVKGGRVHVGSDRTSLYVLNLFSGEPMQTFGAGIGFAADLELVDDLMFAVSANGNLHALSNAFRGPIAPKSASRKM
jgi:outer membrane protein assembly factor BamB